MKNRKKRKERGIYYEKEKERKSERGHMKNTVLSILSDAFSKGEGITVEFQEDNEMS